MIVPTGNMSFILNSNPGASGSEGTWRTLYLFWEEEVIEDGSTRLRRCSFCFDMEGHDLSVCSRKLEVWAVEI